uniref:Uncharacterized protein MANES_05G093200 n=1 Tax=Rhizophora mucronata TaxID=61149 RepID=A0A2P2J7L3_RHIMU
MIEFLLVFHHGPPYYLFVFINSSSTDRNQSADVALSQLTSSARSNLLKPLSAPPDDFLIYRSANHRDFGSLHTSQMQGLPASWRPTPRGSSPSSATWRR